MASRRRPGFDTRAGFRQPVNEPTSGVHPSMLKQARQSGQLNLSNRNLSQVPNCVWRINIDVPEEAQHISLDNTEDRWWEQVDLTKLILASNQLTAISDDINNLPALTVLDIHDNHLTDLPSATRSLVHLTKLNLNHNKLKCLPECTATLTNLQCLLLSHNEIEEIGDHIGNLSNLEELDLSHNKLQRIPQAIGYCRRVMRLNLANNEIRALPFEIGDMQGLRTIEMTHNQLHNLPESVGDLYHLEILYLRHNRLTHLPVLHKCAKLKELHVGNNAIMGLTPEHLQHLTQVSVLDLRDNKISVLPEEITILEGLERLDLTNNDLSALPFQLGNMTKLKSLVLDGNPMKSIRRDIVMRGTNELKKYLRSRLEESPPTSAQSRGNVRATHGASGIIGAGAGDVDSYEVQSSKAIDFSEKKVAEIPEDIWEVATKAEVNKINFSKNQLVNFPERLLTISDSLIDLDLGFNRLAMVTPCVGQLHVLSHLDLRNNQLSSLPQELGSLKMLRELTISCNRFPEVPVVVYDLPRLEVLLASDNQIQTIDAEGYKRLTMLATLDLQNNSIMQVPPELGNCTQLRSLQLGGNPFRVPRPAIVASGTLSLLEYLRGRIAT